MPRYLKINKVASAQKFVGKELSRKKNGLHLSTELM
jgi:hypothetical protein